MSSSVRRLAVGEGAALSSTWVLGGILAAGLVLRLVFIGGAGFHNDISAFESWALTLASHPLSQFYGTAGFADYPPGYFYVLWVVGNAYKLLVHSDPSYTALRVAVKLPAILMDVADTALLYLLVGRFASRQWALAAAALFALNPSAIFVSSYWGQVDSVSAGLVLAALLAMVEGSRNPAAAMRWTTLGWVALAASVLMKPQAAIVGLLFLAMPFATKDPLLRKRRFEGTAIGIAASLILSYLASLPFHPDANPTNVMVWLYGRYAYGSNVYPYNSINAFNLYSVFHPFWQSDATPFMLGPVALGPLWLWGIVLVLAACGLVVARYVQAGEDRALLEGALLLSLAFFCLATRMYERYVYTAFLLSFSLVGFGRRYVYASLALTLTLFANLAYSLAYQTVVEQKIPGIDATDIWPLVTHPLSLLNVAVFFVLGYAYLGGKLGELESFETRVWSAGRAWFAPLQGLARMTPRDFGLATLFTVTSFVVCILWYQYPAEKIFDEIYYARAGEEYLKHVDIFEYTHPPLTKLIITVSMMLFGGLSHVGDSGFGWRFLNILMGALSVGIIYAFGKRLTGSTLFASLAAAMLVLDGFHFVQSRIATPEIGVSFFALCTLYAFYRYWIAAQVRRSDLVRQRFGVPFIVTMTISFLVALAAAIVVPRIGPITMGAQFMLPASVCVFLYVAGIGYLIARLVVPRRLAVVGARTSYAEGSRAIATEDGVTVMTSTGEVLRSEGRGGRAPLGQLARDEMTIVYERDGAVSYTTPEGAARYTPEGAMEAGGTRTQTRDGWLWLGVLSVCGGLLAASKWNGLFDFFVVWGIAAAVALQRFIRKPATFGNPYGIPVDVAVAAMGVVGATIYMLTYIPFFTLGHGVTDVVALQHQMYWYHSTLKATHPYQSQWWQWPFILRPISYYYHDFRVGAALQSGSACCVAEILALPNPFVWWLGLVSIPFAGWIAWRERNKGAALLVVAYVFQWLPWIGSPRIAFEYHFYPNLAMIVLANALLLQRIWNIRLKDFSFPFLRAGVGMYLAVVLLAFIWFYPILAGVHISYDEWMSRMWLRGGIGNWI